MFARIADFLSIYKRGQGVWTRVAAALGILAMGVYAGIQTAEWLLNYRQPGGWHVAEGRYIPYTALGTGFPVALFVIFLLLAYIAGNTTRSANLLIETEIEMRQVTWPSAREVFGATAVVIVVVLLLGLYLFGLDKFFELTLLRWLGLTGA